MNRNGNGTCGLGIIQSSIIELAGLLEFLVNIAAIPFAVPGSYEGEDLVRPYFGGDCPF